MKLSKTLLPLILILSPVYLRAQVDTSCPCGLTSAEVGTGLSFHADGTQRGFEPLGGLDAWWQVSNLSPMLQSWVPFTPWFPAHVTDYIHWNSIGNGKWISYNNQSYSSWPYVCDDGDFTMQLWRDFEVCAATNDIDVTINYDFWVAVDNWVSNISINGTSIYSGTPTGNPDNFLYHGNNAFNPSLHLVGSLSGFHKGSQYSIIVDIGDYSDCNISSNPIAFKLAGTLTATGGKITPVGLHGDDCP